MDAHRAGSRLTRRLQQPQQGLPGQDRPEPDDSESVPAFGIPAGDLEQVSDLFYYATKHQSEEREGTGLGLTVARQIVQEHRGRIEVSSEVGCGTTFLVSLPINPTLLERRKVRKPRPQVGRLF